MSTYAFHLSELFSVGQPEQRKQPSPAGSEASQDGQDDNPSSEEPSRLIRSQVVAPDGRQLCQEHQLMLCSIVETRQQAFLGHADLQVLGALAERHQL